mgnify:CR=1 FL=1
MDEFVAGELTADKFIAGILATGGLAAGVFIAGILAAGGLDAGTLTADEFDMNEFVRTFLTVLTLTRQGSFRLI